MLDAEGSQDFQERISRSQSSLRPCSRGIYATYLGVRTMRVGQSQLERAMSELGFTRDQSTLLWNRLESAPGIESRFEPAHVGYFFGALLVIGAMGWFITDGWDRFAGWQLTTIALIYAALFVVAGSRVWRTP